jgi:hypothetical protein
MRITKIDDKCVYIYMNKNLHVHQMFLGKTNNTFFITTITSRNGHIDFWSADYDDIEFKFNIVFSIDWYHNIINTVIKIPSQAQLIARNRNLYFTKRLYLSQ